MKYYKALLFGSIGSIVETSEIQRKSFNKAFKQYGLDWNWNKDEYQKLLSKSGGKDRITCLWKNITSINTGAVADTTAETAHIKFPSC